MIYVVVDENGPRQVSGAFTAPMTQVYDVWGFPVPKVESVIFPAGWLESASPEELEAAGVHVLSDPLPCPEGHVTVSEKIELDEDGKPYWEQVFGLAPVIEEAKPAPLVSLPVTITLPNKKTVRTRIEVSPDQLAGLGA